MFHTTQLTKFQRVMQGGEDGQQALGELFRIYRPAILGYAGTCFRSLVSNLDEVVDEFMCKKFVEGDIVAAFTPEHGRKFRSYLKAAVRNHCLDFLKKKQRRDAGLGGPVFTLDESFDKPEQAGFDGFDVLWARQVLGRVIRRVKRNCAADRSHRLIAVWGVLQARFLRPLRGRPEIPYPVLVRCYGFSSPSVAQKTATEGKRMLAETLLEVVSDYAGADEARVELNDLWRILNSAGDVRMNRRIHARCSSQD